MVFFMHGIECCGGAVLYYIVAILKRQKQFKFRLLKKELFYVLLIYYNLVPVGREEP